MYKLFLFFAVIGLFSSCKKDKYTTVPQIEFKDIKPQDFASNLNILYRDQAPQLIIGITDAEGDLGIIAGEDTSRVYLKNLNSNNIDSMDFPDLKSYAKKNFKADVSINLYDALECKPGNSPARPRTDSIYYEVYVKDFAGNKSNVIKTGKPVL